MAVLVVIHECTARIPAVQALAGGSRALGDARLFGDVGEFAVAVVVIQNAIAPVRDHQVIVAVVIEIADATSLPPSGTREAGAERHIREGAIAVVLIKPVSGLAAF